MSVKILDTQRVVRVGSHRAQDYLHRITPRDECLFVFRWVTGPTVGSIHYTVIDAKHAVAVAAIKGCTVLKKPPPELHHAWSTR